MPDPYDDPETAPTARYSDSSEDEDLGGVDAGMYGSDSTAHAPYGASEVDDDGDPVPIRQPAGPARGPLDRLLSSLGEALVQSHGLEPV